MVMKVITVVVLLLVLLPHCFTQQWEAIDIYIEDVFIENSYVEYGMKAKDPDEQIRYYTSAKWEKMLYSLKPSGEPTAEDRRQLAEYVATIPPYSVPSEETRIRKN